MNKGFLKSFLLISVLLIWPVRPLHAQQEPKIRILLKDSKKLSFRSDGSKPIFVNGLKGTSKQKVKSLKLQVINREVRLLLNGSLQKTFKLSSNLNLALSSTDSRGIWFGERRYAGKLQIISNGNQLRVINHLTIEKYLHSVVGSEMPKSWPIEALKAQAIAARTYALNELEDQKSDFDIRATDRDQVYLGIESETNKIRKAVNKTRSLVLVYKGDLIDAVFHSCSGGNTEESSLVWGKKRDYLTTVRDLNSSSPHYNWRVKFTPNSLREAFPETGGVNAIRVINRSDTKRVLKALVYGPKGESFYSGQEIRSRLKLKSTLFNIKIIPKDSKSNKRTSYLKPDIDIQKFDDFGYPFPPPIRGTIYGPKLPAIRKDDYLLLAQGSGSGHGVGMSQWGAKAMASRGSNYKRILYHYYKGVKITPFTASYLR